MIVSKHIASSSFGRGILDHLGILWGVAPCWIWRTRYVGGHVSWVDFAGDRLLKGVLASNHASPCPSRSMPSQRRLASKRKLPRPGSIQNAPWHPAHVSTINACKANNEWGVIDKYGRRTSCGLLWLVWASLYAVIMPWSISALLRGCQVDNMVFACFLPRSADKITSDQSKKFQ